VVPNTGSKEQDNLVLPSQTASQTEMPSVELLGQIGSRALHNLVAWWFDKRGERLMPARRDINPIEIPSALGQIWLCDYLSESGHFYYRLAGDEINDFWGFNLSGKYLDEIVPAERLASVTKKYRMALELPAIVYDRACLSLTEEITRNGERIVLPLSDDGRTVNALLGATHRDWFRDLEFDPFSTYSETTTVAALESGVPIH
jgi:hypothetical protein